MTRRRILCRTFMLVLMAAAVCVMSVGIGAEGEMMDFTQGNSVAFKTWGMQSNGGVDLEDCDDNHGSEKLC